MVSLSVTLFYMTLIKCSNWLVNYFIICPKLSPERRLRAYARYVVGLAIETLFFSAIAAILYCTYRLVKNRVLKRYEQQVPVDDLNYEDIQEELTKPEEYLQFLKERDLKKKQLIFKIKMERERSMLLPVELAILSHVSFISRFYQHQQIFRDINGMLKAANAMKLSTKGVSLLEWNSEEKRFKIRRGEILMTFADLRAKSPEQTSKVPVERSETMIKKSLEDLRDDIRIYTSHNDSTPETQLNSENSQTSERETTHTEPQFDSNNLIVETHSGLRTRRSDTVLRNLCINSVDSISERRNNRDRQSSELNQLLNPPTTSRRHVLENTMIPYLFANNTGYQAMARLAIEDSIGAATANSRQSHAPPDHSVNAPTNVHENSQVVVDRPIEVLEDVTPRNLNPPELTEIVRLRNRLALCIKPTPEKSSKFGEKASKVTAIEHHHRAGTSRQSTGFESSRPESANALDDAARAYEILKRKSSSKKPKITKTFGPIDLNKKRKRRFRKYHSTSQEEQVYENFTLAFLATPSNVHDEIYRFETDWKKEPSEADYNRILDAVLFDMTQYG